jgi:hypothetical protein
MNEFILPCPPSNEYQAACLFVQVTRSLSRITCQLQGCQPLSRNPLLFKPPLIWLINNEEPALLIARIP